MEEPVSDRFEGLNQMVGPGGVQEKPPILVHTRNLVRRHRRKTLEYQLYDFKRSPQFTLFACHYEQEQTQLLGDDRVEQFGRGMSQFWNAENERSELQMYFASDFMLAWPRVFVGEGDPFWMSVELTRRPFYHSKTGMAALLIVSVFFKHTRVFVPVFFAVLD